MTAVATISQQIWDMKYRYKKPGGEIVDKSIEDSWRRIAHALAEPETDRIAWEKRFRFLPAIPPGLDRKVFMTRLETEIEDAQAELIGNLFENPPNTSEIQPQ